MTATARQTVAQKIAQGLAFNTLRTVISVLISLVYSIVAVRFLHIQNFGVYAFLDSIFSLLGGLFMPLTHQAESRFVPELLAQGRYPQLRRLIGVGQKVNLLIAFAVAFPFLVFASPIAQALGNSTWTIYIQLMALGMVISAALGILKAILNSFYDQKFLSIWESFFSVASLVLLITFVVFLNWGVMGAILVGLITYGASALLYFFRMNRNFPDNVKGETSPIGKELDSRIRRYVVPSAAINLVSQFGSIYGGVLFLGLLTNSSDVAYFDIPNTFVQRAFSQVTLVIGALSLVSLVEVNVTDPLKLRSAAKQFVKFVSIYAIPVMVGGIVLAAPILTVLYGVQALPAVLPFQILLVQGCITTILQFSSTLLFVKEKAFRAFLWSTLNAVMLISLNLLLIPRMGVLGAVFAAAFSGVATILLFTYDASVRLGVGNIIPTGAILRTSLSAVTMAVALLAFEIVYPIGGAASLLAAMVVGIGVYVLGLRAYGVFTETDRRLVESSSVPFKRYLLRLLWRGSRD